MTRRIAATITRRRTILRLRHTTIPVRTAAPIIRRRTIRRVRIQNSTPLRPDSYVPLAKRSVLCNGKLDSGRILEANDKDTQRRLL